MSDNSEVTKVIQQAAADANAAGPSKTKKAAAVLKAAAASGLIPKIGLGIAALMAFATPWISLGGGADSTQFIAYSIAFIMMIMTGLSGAGIAFPGYTKLFLAFTIAFVMAGLSSGTGPFGKDATDEKLAGVKPTSPKLAKLVIAMIGPLVFGFIDNFGLMLGMDALEGDITSMFGDAEGKVDNDFVGMLGNTVSDALGALMGASLSNMLTQFTGYTQTDGDEHWFEFFGIIIGCLIPAIFKKILPGTALPAIVMLLVIGALIVGSSLLTSSKLGEYTNAEKKTGFEAGVADLKQAYQYQL